MMISTTLRAVRTRWSAVGAAIAITIGGGGVGLIQATSPSGAAAFVPITPCRIMDTRPAAQVGPRSSPLGANDTYSVTGVGTVGECTIPGSATGLVLNITAVQATAVSFLTVWPAGAARPNASHLNPAPGQPPTPNAVTTNLGAGQQFSIFNNAGSVHVFADVVGYYTDHDHDDRYYDKATSDGRYYDKATSDGRYYDRTASDGRYVAQPTDHVTARQGDFEPDSANPASWQSNTGIWNFQTPELPDGACLHAPIDLPTGATLTSVDLSYLRAAGNNGVVGAEDVTILVSSADGSPGPFGSPFEVIKVHYYFEAALPITGATVVARPNLVHDAAGLAALGSELVRQPISGEIASPMIYVCTGSSFTLLNLRVNF